MQSSIWTRCAGASELRALQLEPWRAVEAQHQVSTRKLVDSLEEHALLEELIDRAKPPDLTRGRVHYLLATPFRYPPLRHGSRFGGRHERGIWYGAESHQTMFAEVAYYRLVFLEGTSADLGVVTTQLTAFSVRTRSARAIDLIAPPFASHKRTISSKVSHSATQALGAAMRSTGVELFRYPSARDRNGGVNIGVLAPAAFGAAQPRQFETWQCSATRAAVEVVKRDYFGRSEHVFPREEFLVAGSLPMPGF